MFFDILKDAARLMKKNLNLTQLIFILFVIVMCFTALLSRTKINLKIVPMLVIFFSLLCVSFSGIFFAFKKSLEYDKNPPEEDNPFDLSPLYLSEFFEGIGHYAPRFLFAGIFLLGILAFFMFGYNFFINNFVLIPDKFIEFSKTPDLWTQPKMFEFVNSLSETEQMQISKFALTTLGVSSFYGILTMLYPVSLVSEDTNFFKSFFISIKYLFKNIPISIILFVFFNIAFAFANILSAATVNSIIFSIIALLLQCYLCVWYILSLFVYYEKVK